MRLLERLRPDALCELVGLPATVLGVSTTPNQSLAPGKLPACGWDTFAVAHDAIAPLRHAIEALHRAELPPIAVYAFDATWHIGLALRDAVGIALGARYELVEDFWAFRIEPGRSGWCPHRGTEKLLDRTHPELVNVWLALSDVAANQSCMHLVPLDEDPAFLRGDLADLAAASDRGLASPCTSGTALYWSANVVHWGGACHPDAPGPRVSATFTLARADTIAARGSFHAEELGPWERLDAIADQVLTYAGMADVPRDILDWAAVSRDIRAKMRCR